MAFCEICFKEDIADDELVVFCNPPSWTRLPKTYSCKNCLDNYEPPEETFDNALAFKCEERRRSEDGYALSSS